MYRKRKLKKVCYDRKVQEQNVDALELTTMEQDVVASKLAIEEQNVTTSELATQEQNVVTLELKVGECGFNETNTQRNLKLAMVIVSNPSGRLHYFIIYIK
jgi:hypothetical protein